VRVSSAVLLVDDDTTGRRVAARHLRHAGLEVDEARDGAEALAAFEADRHAVVVTDLKMPGVDGLELLRTLKQRSPDTPVILMTAFGDISLAVTATQEGAWDFIEKPFSRDRMEITLRRALETATLRRQNAALAGVERPIVGHSAAMQAVIELVDRVATSEAPVLVTGESGVGKELVARRLHARSRRGRGPFVGINCAAIPAELLEAELFGHERGAFTGAERAREGRFRRANGGTLFLDEVGELTAPVQAKLLRVLQESQVDPVGADASEGIDVRVVAATNRDIERRVEAGDFREDLYYRLNVLRVHVPPLRERLDDVVPLARVFLAESRPDLRLPEDLAAALRARPWRGNVRELRNVCERLAILAPGREARLADLPVDRLTGPTRAWIEQLPAGVGLMDLEAMIIRQVLDRCDWNVAEASRRLQVPRHILVYRIEKFGLQRG